MEQEIRFGPKNYCRYNVTIEDSIKRLEKAGCISTGWSYQVDVSSLDLDIPASISQSLSKAAILLVICRYPHRSPNFASDTNMCLSRLLGDPCSIPLADVHRPILHSKVSRTSARQGLQRGHDPSHADTDSGWIPMDRLCIASRSMRLCEPRQRDDLGQEDERRRHSTLYRSFAMGAAHRSYSECALGLRGVTMEE
jgi:hypothetical protein